jgi:hypothetical protein
LVQEFAASKLVNIVGGCCGTTKEHITAISKSVASISDVRVPAPTDSRLRLSGLETLIFSKEIPFVNIGERTNISGSREFARLVRSGLWEEATSVARQQVDNGAQIIDINVDDGMIDGVQAMTTLVNLIISEPAIARVPLMIDSSKFHVIEAGLKCAQGRCIVNSIRFVCACLCGQTTSMALLIRCAAVSKRVPSNLFSKRKSSKSTALPWLSWHSMRLAKLLRPTERLPSANDHSESSSMTWV